MRKINSVKVHQKYFKEHAGRSLQDRVDRLPATQNVMNRKRSDQ